MWVASQLQMSGRARFGRWCESSSITQPLFSSIVWPLSWKSDLPDDPSLAGGLHNGAGYTRKLIDLQDTFHPGQQPISRCSSRKLPSVTRTMAATPSSVSGSAVGTRTVRAGGVQRNPVLAFAQQSIAHRLRPVSGNLPNALAAFAPQSVGHCSAGEATPGDLTLVDRIPQS